MTPRTNTPDYWKKVVGSYIRRLRKQKGLNQSALSVEDRRGVSRTALSELERGKVNFTIETLANVLEKLGGDMSEAFQSPVPPTFQGPHADLFVVLADILAANDALAVQLTRLHLELVHERYVQKPDPDLTGATRRQRR